MIKCIAIDDEPLALNVMHKFIDKTPELVLLESFTDAVAAKDYIQKNDFDLIFLDIQMPDINGMQLLKFLKNKPMIIFTTAYSAYAVEGFEVNAVDYLLKPFTFSRFQKAVHKVLEKRKHIEDKIVEESCLYIHADYKLLKIPLDAILYIESQDDYVKIYTTQRNYLTLLSMKGLMGKLPAESFIRIHRSFIVPVNQIKFRQFKKISLHSGIELPVGDTYREELKKVK